VIVLCSLCSSIAIVQGAVPDSTKLSYGAFADVYFAHDLNRPVNGDIAFTTQAPRKDRLDLNLAFVDVRLTSARTRGRLAFRVPHSAMLWRFEARTLSARDAVFPLATAGEYGHHDLVLTSSITARTP